MNKIKALLKLWLYFTGVLAGTAGSLALCLLCYLFFFQNTCHAQSVTMLSGFQSHHSQSGFNDNNTGIGVRIDSGALEGFATGVYDNSIRRTSFYLAREWQWQVAGPVSVGVLAGGVTGYQWAVTPLLLPEAILRIQRVELALLIQPFQVNNLTPAFVSLQARWRF